MFIIFGSKNVGQVIGTGSFHCSRCGTERHYELKRNQRFFTLFFIPIIPLAEIGDTLECTFCKTSYIPQSVLSPAEYHPRAVSPVDDGPLASVGSRFGAFFVDIVFLILLNFPLSFIPLPKFFEGKFQLAFLPIWILYFFLMEVLFKGTIGKKLFKIETISENKDGKVKVYQYFLRSIFKIIAIINIILLFNNKRKGVHDFVANTLVIKRTGNL